MTNYLLIFKHHGRFYYGVIVSKNNILSNEFEFDSITRRTMDRAKSGLIEKRFQINSRKFNGKNYLVPKTNCFIEFRNIMIVFVKIKDFCNRQWIIYFNVMS